MAFAWNHEHSELIKERASHKADITLFADTQKQANKNAEATKARLEKEGKDSAQQADQKYSTLLSEYRTNLLRYKANQGGGNQPTYNQLPTPQGGNGPSASPKLPESSVVISLDDAQICAVNTARLQSVHDWAISLPTKD